MLEAVRLPRVRFLREAPPEVLYRQRSLVLRQHPEEVLSEEAKQAVFLRRSLALPGIVELVPLPLVYLPEVQRAVLLPLPASSRRMTWGRFLPLLSCQRFPPA